MTFSKKNDTIYLESEKKKGVVILKKDYKETYEQLKKKRAEEEIQIEQAQFIKYGRKYRHFKGGYYVVVGRARDQNGDEVVVYVAEDDLSMFVIPTEDWFENVRGREDNHLGFKTRFMLVN